MSPLVAASSIPNRQTGKTNNRHTPTPPPHGNLSNHRCWSACCLRPSPPLRLCLARGSTVNGLYNRSHNKHFSFNEDSLILDVINAYCMVKPRNTVNSVDLLTGGNVQMHDKLARANRTSLNLGRSSSSTQITQQPLQPRNYRPHAPRATTWCCGSFVVRQLRKTQHLE